MRPVCFTYRTVVSRSSLYTSRNYNLQKFPDFVQLYSCTVSLYIQYSTLVQSTVIMLTYRTAVHLYRVFVCSCP